jgi:hypothetical protein
VFALYRLCAVRHLLGERAGLPCRLLRDAYAGSDACTYSVATRMRVIGYWPLLHCGICCSLGTARAVTCNGTADPCDAASASLTDAAAAVLLTPRNGTLRVTGTGTWGAGTLTLTKGIKLIGSGTGSANISGDGSNAPLIQISKDATAYANNEEFRIEGFFFHDAFDCISGDVTGLKTVIGLNNFQNIGHIVFNLGGQARGVVYRNDIDRVLRVLSQQGGDSIDIWLGYPFAYGSDDSLYLESNNIHFTSYYCCNGTGWTEIGQSGRGVLRYNTFDFTNWSNATTYALNDKVTYLNHAWRSLQNGNFNNVPATKCLLDERRRADRRNAGRVLR